MRKISNIIINKSSNNINLRTFFEIIYALPKFNLHLDAADTLLWSGSRFGFDLNRDPDFFSSRGLTCFLYMEC